jgi:hypothetical protein
MALRRSDESNDFRAQDNPSHTAMTTSPANASAIKYAVMSFSFLNQSCGMIACAIIFRHEPYLHQMEARVRTRTCPTPRAGAFGRAGQ